MKNFIEVIKKRDAKITKFFEKQALSKLEKMFAKLEDEHNDVKKHLKQVNYLLNLIENHQIETFKQEGTKVKNRKNWLKKIKSTFERFHLLKSNDLSSKDIEFLQEEKSKLLFEKAQLEKEHHHIHQLIAKTEIYIIDVRNTVCKEITKGYDIAAVGEKLLEHFGKEIAGNNDYDLGRRKIIKYVENLFSIDKIKAHELVDLLEKSRVINYKTDYSNIIPIPDAENFLDFTNLNYTPLFGNWYINA